MLLRDGLVVMWCKFDFLFNFVFCIYKLFQLFTIPSIWRGSYEQNLPVLQRSAFTQKWKDSLYSNPSRKSLDLILSLPHNLCWANLNWRHYCEIKTQTEKIENNLSYCPNKYHCGVLSSSVDYLNIYPWKAIWTGIRILTGWFRGWPPFPTHYADWFIFNITQANLCKARTIISPTCTDTVHW